MPLDEDKEEEWGENVSSAGCECPNISYASTLVRNEFLKPSNSELYNNSRTQDQGENGLA